jgi:flagellar biosynthetic protein FliQ
MDTGTVIELVFQALRMAAILGGPAMLALLVVGLFIGILQAATQVNESSVAFIPKLLVLGVVLLLAGPASLMLFIDYLRDMLMRIPTLVN